MPENQDKPLTPRELLEKHKYQGKLTRRFREKALAKVRAGAPPRVALRAQGLSMKSVRIWQALSEDEDNTDKRAIFFRELLQAEADYISFISEQTRTHAAKDGRVCVDILARRDAEHWGRKDELNVGVQVEAGPVFKAIAEAYQSGRLRTGEYKLLEGEGEQKGIHEGVHEGEES